MIQKLTDQEYTISLYLIKLVIILLMVVDLDVEVKADSVILQMLNRFGLILQVHLDFQKLVQLVLWVAGLKNHQIILILLRDSICQIILAIKLLELLKVLMIILLMYYSQLMLVKVLIMKHIRVLMEIIILDLVLHNGQVPEDKHYMNILRLLDLIGIHLIISLNILVMKCPIVMQIQLQNLEVQLM